VAEGGDLHGEGEARSEPLAELGLVHDDNELVRAHLHHLFAKEGSSAALHQVEVGVDFVRAINRNIELGVSVQCHQRNSKFLRLLLRPHASGNRHDVCQLPALQLLPEPLHGEVGGGTGSEADDHPGLDVVVHRLVPDHLLELVLRQGRLRLRLLHRDSVRSSDDDGRRHIAEQSVVHHSDSVLEFGCHGRRI